MNAPLSVTASGVFTALKMAIDSAGVVPPNSGAVAPGAGSRPEGTVVNARFPAPVVYANHEISHRVCDMVSAPSRPSSRTGSWACSQGTSAVLTLGGVDYRTEEHYVSYETVKGGFGARPDRDGISAIASGISNTMNTPVEVIEMSFPVRVESYELLPDSGGAGRWRGGLGARRTWRILERDSRATVCCERTRSPPFGIAGGAAGAPARISVVEPDGAERILNSKGSFDAPAGSLVVFDVPGSGGYGPAEVGTPRGFARISPPATSPRTERAARLRRARSRRPPPGRERRSVEGTGLRPLSERPIPRAPTPATSYRYRCRYRSRPPASARRRGDRGGSAAVTVAEAPAGRK